VRRGTLLVLASLIVVLSPSSAQGQALNIDLGGVLGTPSDAYRGASGQTGRWNTITGTSYTYDLLDTSGVATPVDITISDGNLGGWVDVCAEADARVFVNDNHWADAYWKMVVLGLTNGDYELFLYSPSDPGVVTGDMSVNGTPVASISGDDCGLVEGVGWTRVVVEVQGGSFWMVGNGVGTIGLAGMQLRPIILIDSFESGDTSAWSSTVQ